MCLFTFFVVQYWFNLSYILSWQVSRWGHIITFFMLRVRHLSLVPLKCKANSFTKSNFSRRKVKALTPGDLKAKMYYQVFCFPFEAYWSLSRYCSFCKAGPKRCGQLGRREFEEHGSGSKKEGKARVTLYDRKHWRIQSMYSKFRDLLIF